MRAVVIDHDSTYSKTEELVAFRISSTKRWQLLEAPKKIRYSSNGYSSCCVDNDQLRNFACVAWFSYWKYLFKHPDTKSTLFDRKVKGFTVWSEPTSDLRHSTFAFSVLPATVSLQESPELFFSICLIVIPCFCDNCSHSSVRPVVFDDFHCDSRQDWGKVFGFS